MPYEESYEPAEWVSPFQERRASNSRSRTQRASLLDETWQGEDFAWDNWPDERGGASRNRREREEDERGYNTGTRRSERKSKRERRRRQQAKERAGKLFERQYAGSEDMPDMSGQSPRAALYEAKMGSSHKRAARMQRAGSALPVSVKIDPAGWFSSISVSPRTLRLATALLCVVLTALFLYTPAQQYYQSVRDADRLAIEYETVAARNQAIQDDNTALVSDAGMEDAVRQRYGYIKDGDQTAVVTGLSEQAQARAGKDGVEANVLASGVKAPEEWYTPILDAFFGIE